MSPEISDVIEVESNLSHKGDICWFTIGYRAAAIVNSSPKYGRIKYLIEIEGEEPAGPVEIGSKDVLNALSRDIPELVEVEILYRYAGKYNILHGPGKL